MLTKKASVWEEKARFPDEYAAQPPFGRKYDKFPFKMFLEAGKTYNWCSCGYSKHQVSNNETTLKTNQILN